MKVMETMNGISVLTDFGSICIGLIRTQIAKTRAMLATLLPMTFPRAISGSGTSLRAAERLTMSSGADVPKATIVRPITRGLILKSAAILEAPSTSQSAENQSKITPARSIRISISIRSKTHINVKGIIAVHKRVFGEKNKF